jgi:N-acyl-D-amino-acid deacylase
MRLVSFLVSASLACLANGSDDLHITGGRVIDGTGNPWFYAGVAIDEGRIVAVGDLAGREAQRVIDASGRVVAPGFIDVHTHVDADIHDSPPAENFVRNGVTTIVTGNCGGSVIDVARYFSRIEDDGAGVNVATLIGHNSVLREVKGSVATPMTPEQLDRAKALVDQAMKDGAVGLSTGLIYTPGRWSTTEEIIELAKMTAPYQGIYATHMRSEGGAIESAIEEALRVGREGGVRVQISHFKLPTDVAERFGRGTTLDAGSDRTLGMVARARADGQEVWIDQYPYTASSTTLNVMLPDWVLENGGDAARSILRDPAQLERVFEDMRANHEVARRRTDLSYAVITSAQGFPEFSGKSVKQAAQLLKFRREQGEFPELLGENPPTLPDVSMREQYEAVVEIYLAGGAGAVYHTMDETEVKNILAHPLVAVASDSGLRIFGRGTPHPRGYGTNSRVLGRYVRELGVISLEDAVRKMTSMPARAFRFDDRGELREGMAADVVIFDPATVADQATFDQPHQWPVGIETVIVNGRIVFENGAMTGTLSGRPIRGRKTP